MNRLTVADGGGGARGGGARARWQVTPERYFEHAEQVTPDDKPLAYIRLKVSRLPCGRRGL